MFRNGAHGGARGVAEELMDARSEHPGRVPLVGRSARPLESLARDLLRLTTMGLAQASVAALRALVLGTALTPVFAVLLATLVGRAAGERARGAR